MREARVEVAAIAFIAAIAIADTMMSTVKMANINIACNGRRHVRFQAWVAHRYPRRHGATQAGSST